jgi:hypothetical protein
MHDETLHQSIIRMEVPGAADCPGLDVIVAVDVDVDVIVDVEVEAANAALDAAATSKFPLDYRIAL